MVQAFMAHHQGMTIVAIADTLLDGRMRARFHADPMVQATELLLQERVPRDVVPPPPSVAESAASAHERGRPGRLAARQPMERDAGHATAVERTLLRHADGGRLRLQRAGATSP